MADPTIDDLAGRAADDPQNGAAAFCHASALDAGDEETKAIPIYRHALACGLSEEMEYRARVQLGSSLRVAGKPKEATVVHQGVSARWPDRAANRLFLALALHQAGRSDEAVSEAMQAALIETGSPDIDYYRRALSAYAQLLNQGRGDVQAP